MQFTQIQQISSFSLHKYSTSAQYLSFPNEQQQSNQNKLQSQEDQFQQLIHNLNQLHYHNHSQSNQFNNISHNNKSTESINIRQTNQTINQNDNKEHLEWQCHKKYDRTKSIIFNSSFTINRSSSSNHIHTHSIKVFYFNTPITKLIPYNKLSTVKQLIQNALDTYLIQNNDTIRSSQSIQRFQMRLPISQNDFQPDMDIEPIHNDRVLSENMFQTLILVQKPKKQLLFESKPTKQYSFQQTNMSYSGSMKSQFGSGQMIKFILMDQTYFQLMRIQLDKDGTLEKLFKIIKQNNLNNQKQFVIKDDPQSQFDLLPDHQVKFIEKNRLYLMTKKYLDEGEDQMPGPIRLKTLIHQQINYLPPIGINQASKYQQFEVTKINSLGIAIQRVLGIDQTKIYNYHKQLIQQKRQISLMDKFLGINIQTGTKKPFRLIKDINEIKKFPGGIQVVYPDKNTTYLIKNQIDLQKIYRKLDYLLDLNKKDKQGNSSLINQSPKKSSLFFKF